MRFCKIIPLILVFSSIIIAQSQSVHKKDLFKNNFNREIFAASKFRDIKLNPIKTGNKNLTHAIFGFLPDWEFVQSPPLRLDLLTHLGFFPFETDSTGNISLPMNWPWTNLINQAHEAGIKILLTIVNFNPSHIRSIISVEENKLNLIDNVLSIISIFNLDGIIVDFEGLYDEDEGEPIIDFLEELSKNVKSLNQNFEVAFATPAINWNNDWNFIALADHCDFLFVMEYDFYGSWSELTGPVAPLEGNLWNINITRSVLEDYQEVLNSDPKKIILGFPYYGAHFISDGNYPGASVIDFVENPRYKEIINISGAEYLWSDEFRNSWLRWNDIDWNQIWFDDSLSLSLKYDFAIEHDVRGIGIWALGYDGNLSELWNLLQNKFDDNASAVTYNNQVPKEFNLMQNYPNPFNPITKIQFSLPAIENEYSNFGTITTLRVFDNLGREVETLLSKHMLPGNYEIEFNAKKLSSGVYFYRLTSYKFSSSKKMILLR